MGSKIGKMLREKVGQLLDQMAEVLDKNKPQLSPVPVKVNQRNYKVF